MRVRNFRRFSFWANSTTEKSHLVLNSVAFGFADYIRIVGGLGVGATFVYSGNNQRLAGKKISTDYYSIMPHLKMRWLNLRILSLYSRVGVGLTFTESSGEGQSESARQWAFQVSPIGVEIGGKVAAYAEAGIGTMGSLVAGLRFRF